MRRRMALIVRQSIECSRKRERRRSKPAEFIGLVLVLVSINLFGLPQSVKSRRSAPQPAAQLDPRLLEAKTLFSQGRSDEAKQKIQELLNLHPSSGEGYNLLGIIYGGERNYDGAVEAFQHALQVDPSSAGTRNNLGNSYVAQNKLALAENEFRMVLRLDPRNRDANYNLGLLLMAERSPAQAIMHFQRAQPANLETRFNLIRAYLQAGRTAQGRVQAAHRE